MAASEYALVHSDEEAGMLAPSVADSADRSMPGDEDELLSRHRSVTSDITTSAAPSPPSSPIAELQRVAEGLQRPASFADELEQDRLLLAKSLRKKHDSRAPKPGMPGRPADSEHAPSPIWFESAPFNWIADTDSHLHKLVLTVLVLAPFVQLGGPVMELVNGCAHHNEQAPERTVRATFAFGVFMFCATWPMWFRNLARVVRIKTSADDDGCTSTQPSLTSSANEFMYDFTSPKQALAVALGARAIPAGSGPLQQLRRERKPNVQRVTDTDPLGNQHRWLTKKAHAQIEGLRPKMLFLSAIMLLGVLYITTVFVEVQLFGVRGAPEVADTVLDFFIPKQGCVTRDTERVYLWALIGVWCVAAAATSLVMPAWLLSLQLASTLAADAVDDVMIHVGQLVFWSNTHGSKTHCISPEVVDSDGWESNVQIPVAMLVVTMQQLSAWGPAMAMTVAGCWTCALCAVPTLVATQNRLVLGSTMLLFLVPFLVALAPANVSSSCDDLLEQLNDLSLLGDTDHKQRVDSLHKSMNNLNRGQGLGFKVMGTVVDRRTLVRVGMGLSAGTGLLTKLAAMGSGLDASVLHHANVSVVN